MTLKDKLKDSGIGSKYTITKENLIFDIMENPKIAIEKDRDKRYACYLCRHEIKDKKMFEINQKEEINGVENTSTYRIDKKCLDQIMKQAYQ